MTSIKRYLVPLVLVGGLSVGAIAAKPYVAEAIDLFGSWSSQGISGNVVTAKGQIDYSISVLKYKDLPYLVMITKGAQDLSSSNSAARTEGVMIRPNQSKIEWKSDRTHDIPQTVPDRLTIGAQTFDLRKGSVILVDARNNSLKVEQIASDQPKYSFANQLETALAGQRSDSALLLQLRQIAPDNQRLSQFLQEFKPSHS